MVAEAAAAEPLRPPIQIVDVLGNFVVLEARSATLDGSLPLRAAQACTPLLEGNAVGRELVLAHRIELSRSLRGVKIERFDHRAKVEARARAVVPMLGPLGLADAFVSRFTQSPLRTERRRIELFCGLLVTAPRGLRLRIGSTSNRRPRAFLVEEQIIAHEDGPTPIVLSMKLEDLGEGVVLEGEIATIVPLIDRLEARYQPLSSALDAARSHVRFYDERYFESKKRGATRKYRDLVREQPKVSDTEPAAKPAAEPRVVDVVECGPRQVEIASDRLRMRAGVPFTFFYDGSTVSVHVAEASLESMAAAIREAWAPVLSEALANEAVFRGALLYLTKYVTPHPRGEPHFFVKPPALVVTPPGWSTLIEGRKSLAFDVLRGVVRTDIFHAIPSVFAIANLGTTCAVRPGDWLADLFPSPRHVLERPFVVRTIDDPLELGPLRPLGAGGEIGERDA